MPAHKIPTGPDDFVCPPEHGHGVSTGCYTLHRCRCRGCRDAAAAWAHRRYWLVKTRRWSPFTPAVGTHRRLRALVATGWSQSALARELGWSQSAIARIFAAHSDIVQTSTHRQVVALFDRLWDAPAPQGDRYERQAYIRSRNLARQRGWLPPLAWDDIDLDPSAPGTDDDLDVGDDYIDEVAVELAVDGADVRLTTAERHEAIRILNGRKYSDADIAQVLGLATRTVERNRHALGIPAALGADGMPIAS